MVSSLRPFNRAISEVQRLISKTIKFMKKQTKIVGNFFKKNVDNFSHFSENWEKRPNIYIYMLMNNILKINIFSRFQNNSILCIKLFNIHILFIKCVYKIDHLIANG